MIDTGTTLCGVLTSFANVSTPRIVIPVRKSSAAVINLVVSPRCRKPYRAVRDIDGSSLCGSFRLTYISKSATAG